MEGQRKHILVVDDVITNLKYAQEVLKNKYKIALAKSGESALRFLEKNIPDLILLDINMSDLDGFETYECIKSNPLTTDIPVVFMTSDYGRDSERQGFRLGARDIIKKPFEPEIMLSRVARVLEYDTQNKELIRQVQLKSEEAEKVTLQTMTAIASTTDAKDLYTRTHAVSVSFYATEIARRMKLKEENISSIKYAGLLHDIGKIGISDSILSKPGILTEEEFSIIKAHSTIGADILKNIKMIKTSSEAARYHHERFDGTGYPLGLKGFEIPLAARIVGVADAYDAMSSDRSYRQHLSEEAIREELQNQAGKQFDPEIAVIMLSMMEDGIRFTENNADSDADQDVAQESGLLLQQVLSEYTKEMKMASQKDSLTGLFNRNYLEERVNEYLEDKDKKGILFILDMDNFKMVNDTYGHTMGDSVLSRFSNTLKVIIREDDVACRIGGDEFILFIKGKMSKEAAEEKAREILEALERSMRTPISIETDVSVSIGIAMAPADGNDFLTLYQNADRALYHVKQNGKRGYHFYRGEDQHKDRISEAEVLSDLPQLKQYIEEKDYSEGAFQVEYESFKRIYQFVSRYIGRTRQKVQTLLLTLQPQHKEDLPGEEEYKEAMEKLEHAIRLSLRRGDVSNFFSNSQFIVILMDTSKANGKMVANRIKDTYSRMNQKNRLVLEFDIQEIETRKEDQQEE